MKKNKLLILVFAFIGLCDSFYSHAEIVYYTHPDLRLKFALNTNTKEASLGTGLDMNEQNAIALPPLGDPWWDESPSPTTGKTWTYPVRLYAKVKHTQVTLEMLLFLEILILLLRSQQAHFIDQPACIQ